MGSRLGGDDDGYLSWRSQVWRHCGCKRLSADFHGDNYRWVLLYARLGRLGEVFGVRVASSISGRKDEVGVLRVVQRRGFAVLVRQREEF